MRRLHSWTTSIITTAVALDMTMTKAINYCWSGCIVVSNLCRSWCRFLGIKSCTISHLLTGCRGTRMLMSICNIIYNLAYIYNPVDILVYTSHHCYCLGIPHWVSCTSLYRIVCISKSHLNNGYKFGCLGIGCMGICTSDMCHLAVKEELGLLLGHLLFNCSLCWI